MKRLALFVAVLLAAAWSQVAIGAEKKVAPTKTEAAAPATAETKTGAKKAGEAKKHMTDLNSATADELKALPGLTDADVKKIVDNRPYKRKDELVKKKIVPQTVYDGIKDQIVAKQVTAKKR